VVSGPESWRAGDTHRTAAGLRAERHREEQDCEERRDGARAHRELVAGRFGKLEVDALIVVGFLGCGQIKIGKRDLQAVSGSEV